MGFLGRIKEGLARTKQQIVERFDEIVKIADAPERRSRPIDVETIDALEELLISADIGVAATDRIVAAVRTRSRNGASLRDLVKEEIRSVFAREVAGAPHEVLLVLDATVGQNGVSQAREFMSVAGVNGIVLTKLDGTAKGGVAVAIAHDLKLPIRYVGVGETIDDLVPFSADEYVNGLFEEKW